MKYLTIFNYEDKEKHPPCGECFSDYIIEEWKKLKMKYILYSQLSSDMVVGHRCEKKAIFKKENKKLIYMFSHTHTQHIYIYTRVPTYIIK